MRAAETVIWHDLECGGYTQDLKLWVQLARDSGDPVLDVGAGTGRVSLELLRHGHTVVALDRDQRLLTALRDRADTLPPEASARCRTVAADACDFRLGGDRFALCMVPMQTIQLLGGRRRRLSFLRRAHEHLDPGGVLAVAIAPSFDEFDGSCGDGLPLPDMVELDGSVYSSHPTAVRRRGNQVILERTREVVGPAGDRRVSEDRVALDIVGPGDLVAEGAEAGLRPVGTHTVPETEEHVGSLVVIFRAP